MTCRNEKMASRQKEIVGNKADEVEDLLVFGYSCKLFRDDEKALYIDQGKHLIPWMGDDTLKIDRYDARGTLYDLKEVEAPSGGGFDRFFGLTDIEKQAETMCDEERYRALMTNEEEESLYQEEELKRLHLALGDKGKEYGQVEYKYDGNSNDIETVSVEAVDKPFDAAEDEPFVPPPQLDVPSDMIIPESVKHNAIIEKTAFFINSQGPQMEILLKMKQAGNPLFNFLSFDNPLHSYYRHLLMAVKGGRYKPDLDKPIEKTDAENEEDDSYLHPSLASVSKVELAPSIPSINYKPSAHCAYSMLVNKIKDKKAKGDTLPNLTRLKNAIQRLNDKKEEINSGNESDSNCSSESKSSVKSKSSSHSTISLNSFKSSQTDRRRFETPPNDVQVIIDKMASYVAKNGRDFEAIVQMKKDPRFDFLNSSHIFYPYYQNKVKQYENLDKSEVINKSSEISLKGKEEQTKTKLTPVCFSIKKAKESESVIEKSALPIEESSDEEEKEYEKNDNVIVVEEREKERREDIVTVDLAAAEEKEEKNKKILAAERIKDKLTAAVREKVAIASKEKQLQLERKRRAIAFLKNLQAETGNMNISSPHGPHLPDRHIMGRITDDDSDVTSLPDEIDDFVEERNNSAKMESRLQRDQDGNDKRHKTYNLAVRHRSSGKKREKLENMEKVVARERKVDDVPIRTNDSPLSSDENEKRKANSVEDCKLGKRIISEECYFTSKMDRINLSHSEDRKHKRRKHRKEDGRDRNSRKHFKPKPQRRSKESDSERRCKRSRCSGSSSDP